MLVLGNTHDGVFLLILCMYFFLFLNLKAQISHAGLKRLGVVNHTVAKEFVRATRVCKEMV